MNMREETRSTTGLTGRGQHDAQGTRADLRQVRKGNDDHHTRQHVADSDGSTSCLEYPVRHAMVSGPVYPRALCAQPRSNDGSLSQTARITWTGTLVFPPNTNCTAWSATTPSIFPKTRLHSQPWTALIPPVPRPFAVTFIRDSSLST